MRKLRNLLTRIETWLAGASLMLLLALSVGQIIARNFFDTGLPAADTLARHLVLYVTFFGAVIAVETRSHIKIDVVTTWMQPATLRRLFQPLQGIGALVCAVFTVAATRYWLDAWAYATVADRWTTLLELIMPVGFGLLTLHFLLGALFGPARADSRS